MENLHRHRLSTASGVRSCMDNALATFHRRQFVHFHFHFHLLIVLFLHALNLDRKVERIARLPFHTIQDIYTKCSTMSQESTFDSFLTALTSYLLRPTTETDPTEENLWCFIVLCGLFQSEKLRYSRKCEGWFAVKFHCQRDKSPPWMEISILIYQLSIVLQLEGAIQCF